MSKTKICPFRALVDLAQLANLAEFAQPIRFADVVGGHLAHRRVSYQTAIQRLASDLKTETSE